MIRPPSQVRDYDEFVSIDPAFRQAPTPPGEKATDEERAQYKEARADYDAKLTAARDTGEWKPLAIEGQTPTKFVMRQVDRNVWRALMDRAMLPVDSARHIGQVMMNALLFRLAVTHVTDFDKFERRPDRNWDDWVMAPAALVTQLDEIDPAIVGELGGAVFRRLQGVSGKS
jgi:hypothetical protein